mmetsp:Transcript_81019/g.234945  ORF Transcript_81019/g.234945 Transcript_81019/m.234945 type:complete len:83 (-) Transcript_81019:1519-1767(-)
MRVTPAAMGMPHATERSTAVSRRGMDSCLADLHGNVGIDFIDMSAVPAAQERAAGDGLRTVCQRVAATVGSQAAGAGAPAGS